MTISASSLSILVWAALIVTIAAPVILLVLFILDLKKRQLW